jgi:hypothetical protein
VAAELKIGSIAYAARLLKEREKIGTDSFMTP